MVFGPRCVFHALICTITLWVIRKLGGEGSMMIELCVMFNHGLSEDDVTITVADFMSLYSVRRSNNIVIPFNVHVATCRDKMCILGSPGHLLDCVQRSHASNGSC